MKKIVLVLLVFFTQFIQAQLLDPVKWTQKIEKISDTEYNLVFNGTIDKDWHMYSQYTPDGGALPLEVIYDSAKGNYEAVGKAKESPYKKHFNEVFGVDEYYFENKVKIQQRIKVINPKLTQVVLKLNYQVCKESCINQEKSFTFVLPKTASATAIVEQDSLVTDTAAVEVATPKVVKAETQEPPVAQADQADDKGWLTIFILAFLGGFAALLTPCVFPMIPMTVSFFTKSSKSKAAGIRNAIFYGISIIAIYVILGTIVTTIFGPSALNALSTNVWFNIIFFILLVVFALSFLGAFEIMLPSSWQNKADQASDKGGILGIFFMALALALVSFSCTGPIVGTLLVESATIGGIAPFVGMFGFSLALALPFTLFAAFPGWMNSLPKSGGWLNTVKVFLGFLELALAFKFLSNADLVVQGHFLERELFLAIWIGLFTVLTIYLFGFIRLPHDSPTEKLSVFRTMLASTCLVFVIYLIPGMWGAPLKLISGFPPPLSYSESPSGIGTSQNTNSHSGNKDMHLGPQNIMVFHDFDKAVAYAKEVHKPLFVDFTGHACNNCRKMEEKVWGEPGILEILRDKMVIVSLYMDEKTALPASEHKELEYAPGKKTKITQVGEKWSYLQTSRYKSNTMPYYRILGPKGEDLDIGPADYEHHGNATDFKAWLEKGLEEYKKADTKN